MANKTSGRILSLLLAIAMLLSAGVPAFAAESAEDELDQGIEEESGLLEETDEGSVDEENLTQLVKDSIAYDQQPTSVDDVQAAIDAFIASGYEIDLKPRWEYEVDAALMPDGYRCEYVDEGYWTFFAGVSATATTVSNFDDFKAAVLAGGDIELTGDITATDNIGSSSAYVVRDFSIDGNGYTLEMGDYGIYLAGSHTLSVKNLTIQQTGGTTSNAIYGVFSMRSTGQWNADFENLTFHGSALVTGNAAETSSTSRYFDQVTFSGNTDIVIDCDYRAYNAVVYARNVTISDSFSMVNNEPGNNTGSTSPSEQAYFRSPNSSGGQGYEHSSSVSYGSFRVTDGAEVSIIRKQSNGSSGANTSSNYRSLIYGYETMTFGNNSTFYGEANTNRNADVLYRSAVIRSNNIKTFSVGNGADVSLVSGQVNRSSTNKGFTALYLGKQSGSNLDISVGIGAKLSIQADGENAAARARAPVMIMGAGTSNTTVQGELTVRSENGNGWYYEHSTSARGKNTFLVDGGVVDILANNGGVKGSREYAAFEAYGRYDMEIRVQNAGTMSVVSNGYRGMSLAGYGDPQIASHYASKSITVTGEGSKLDITGVEWAIAAEAYPILSITAENGGEIDLATSGDVGDGLNNTGGAPSTVYTVGPVTYTVDGSGSSMRIYHRGGTYSAIFHDGYGPLTIDVKNGGKMEVENHNSGTDTSARRAAITAQSTYIGAFGSRSNVINVDGDGSELIVTNTNPYTHGTVLSTGAGGDTGLYPTGAVSFNSTAQGDINVTNGGSFKAYSESRAPTIHLNQGVITFDRPGDFEIRNNAVESTIGNNSTYATEGQAVYNERYRNASSYTTAIKFVECDVTVWSTYENLYDYDAAHIDNSWKNVSFEAKNKETVPTTDINGTLVIGGGGDGTYVNGSRILDSEFHLSAYGRINGSGKASSYKTVEGYEEGQEITTPVAVGEQVTFEIHYINNTGKASDVTITDKLSDALQYVNHTDETGKVMDGDGYDAAAHEVVWQIADVPVGGTGVVTVTVEVTNRADSSVLNSAIIDWDEGDDPEDPGIEVPVGARKRVDENSEAGVGGTAVVPGDEITYEIAYKNHTDDDAWLTITDYLDPQVTYVGSTDENGDPHGPGYYDSTDHKVEWDDIRVRSGAEGSVTVTVRVDDGAEGSIVNEANLVWKYDGGGEEEEDPGEENPIGSTKSVAAGSPGENGEKIVPGDVITYEINYVNTSGKDATKLVITDTLPAYLEYVSSSTGGVYDPATRTITWTIEPASGEDYIADTGVVTVTVEVVVDQETEIINEAGLTWTYGEEEEEETPPPPVNPVGSYKVVAADSEAGVDGAQVMPGDKITYEIVYINNQGADADLTVVDTLPAGVDLIECEPAPDDISGNVLTWKVGSVGDGERGVIRITVEVNAEATGTITNEAELTWTVEGEEPETEEPEVTNPIGSTKRLYKVTTADGEEITEDVRGMVLNVGDILTYRITYVNNYGKDAEKLVITDTLANGLGYVSHTGPDGTTLDPDDYDAGSRTITWTIDRDDADLTDGSSGYVEVTVEVLGNIGEKVVNTANLTWTFEDGELPETPPEEENPVASHKYVSEDSENGVDGAVVHVGDEITYRIVYVNNADKAADGLVITDTLPTGLRYVSSYSSDGINADVGADGRTLTWRINKTIEPGDTGYVDVTVVVTEDVGVEITNEANIKWSYEDGTGGEEDPEVTNPVGTKKIVAEGSIGQGGSAVRPGDEITYEITYVNNTGKVATATITDYLSDYLIYESHDPGDIPYDSANHMVTWVISDIQPGEYGTVTLTVRVDNINTDEVDAIVNEAHVEWETEDGDEDPEDPGTENPVVEGSTKYIPTTSQAGYNGALVYVGDQITYELFYFNQTGEDADLVIVDELHEDVKYVGHTDENGDDMNGVGYDPATHTVTWTITGIPDEATGVVSLTVEVIETAWHEITNDAIFKWYSEGDEPGDNNTIDEEETPEVVNPIGSKKVVIVDDEIVTDYIPAQVGDIIQFRIYWFNRLDETQTVTIVDYLANSVNYVDSSDNGVYDAADHTVTWEIENAAPGDEGYVDIWVEVNDRVGPTIINRADVSLDDGNDINIPVASKKVVAEGSIGEEGGVVHVGDEITYEIMYVNNLDRYADVKIVDALDPGVEHLYHTAFAVGHANTSNYDPVDHEITWLLKNIAPGESGTLYVHVKVLDTAGETISNSAQLTWSDPENGGNEIGEPEEPGVTNPVGSRKYVETIERDGVEVDDTKSVVYVGDEITYAIKYVNYNEARADLVITDYLPEGAEYVSSEPEGEYDSAAHTVTWRIDGVDGLDEDVAAGGIVYVTVRLTGEMGTEVVNRAELEWFDADDTDPNRPPIDKETPEVTNPGGSKKTIADGSAAGANGKAVTIGDEITYEITYVNNSDEYRTVEITDHLADGLRFISSTGGTVGTNDVGNRAGVYDTDEHTVTWLIHNVPAGASGVVTVTVEVIALTGAELVNGAQLVWDEEEPEIPPPVEVPTGSRKYVSGETGQSGDYVHVDDEITYRIEYVNNFDEPATLVITDTLDPGVEYVSSTDDGTYDPSAHTVTWEITTSVEAGEVGYVEVVVRVTEDAGDEIHNNAYIEWKTEDGIEPEIPPEVVNPVGSRKYVADDSEAGVDGAPVYIGDRITYEIKYINTNDVYATLTVEDTLPSGVRFISAEPGETRRSGNTVIWEIGVDNNPIAPGESGVVRVTVEVTDVSATEIVNTASLTWRSGSTELPDEDIDVTNPVGSQKIVPNGTGMLGNPVKPGDTITYEILYSNYFGRGDATVEIVDTLPPYTTYVDHTNENGASMNGTGYNAADRTVTWTIANVPQDTLGRVTVTVTVDEDATGELENLIALNWTFDDDGEEETEVPPPVVNPVDHYKVIYYSNYTPEETVSFTHDLEEYHTVRGVDEVSFVHPEGYEFIGWTTVRNVITIVHEPGEEIRGNNDGIIELFAIWDDGDAGEYEITYHALNDSDEEYTTTELPGVTHYVLDNGVEFNFVNPGYVFMGWSESEEAEDADVPVGTPITGEDGDRFHLYAVWYPEDEAMYTVIYDANGGSGGTRTFSVPAGTAHTILTGEQVGFYRQGYSFIGWSDSANSGQVVWTPNGTLSLTGEDGDVFELYAVWEQNVVNEYYNVVYNANGGTGGISGTYTYSVLLGTAHSVVGNPNSDFTFTRSGHTFLGWATTANASAPNAGTTVSGSYAGQTVTLYAVWQDNTPQTYTVVYNANGGTGGPVEYTVQVGTAHTVVSNSVTGFTRSGYTFQGWATTSTATAPNAGTTVTGTAGQTITLYAVWEREQTVEPNSYTVTFHWNHSEVATDVYRRSTVSEGDTVTSPADPTLDGWVFEGWYLDADCTRAYDFTTPVTGDLDLYANWEPVPGLVDEPEFKLSPDHFAYLMGYEEHDNILPSSNITRAEVATIFFRVIEDETREEFWSKTNDYTDIQYNDWHNNAISTVSSMGLFTGYPDGTFLPGNPITRQEFAAVAARFLAVDAYDGEDLFPDISDPTVWAREEINIAAQAGWLKGDDDGNFNPKNYITRAEVATIINRMRDCTPQTVDDLLPADDMITWPDNADTTEWYYIAIQEASNSHFYDEYGNGWEKWTALRENRNWAILQNVDSTPYQLYEGEEDWNPRAPGYVAPTE